VNERTAQHNALLSLPFLWLSLWLSLLLSLLVLLLLSLLLWLLLLWLLLLLLLLLFLFVVVVVVFVSVVVVVVVAAVVGFFFGLPRVWFFFESVFVLCSVGFFFGFLVLWCSVSLATKHKFNPDASHCCQLCGGGKVTAMEPQILPQVTLLLEWERSLSLL